MIGTTGNQVVRAELFCEAPAGTCGTPSFTSVEQRLVKTGGRLIQHARYYWLLLAERHLTRRLFGGMLAKIAMLPSPAE